LQLSRRSTSMTHTSCTTCSGVLVQRLLRYTGGAENGLHSRGILHFCRIKLVVFLQNVMQPFSSESSSVGAPTQSRRFTAMGNGSKSARIP
jgi:hypothetical protein